MTNEEIIIAIKDIIATIAPDLSRSSVVRTVLLSARERSIG